MQGALWGPQRTALHRERREKSTYFVISSISLPLIYFLFVLQEPGNACQTSRPITVSAACIAALHNYISGKVCVRLVHHLDAVAGGGQKSGWAAWIFLPFFYQLQPLTPSFPAKGVCTRSNGPINCLDYSMCRYLSAVLVVPRRWFSRGECAREEQRGGGRKGGKETRTGLTWTDGRPMECDRPSCTHTRTARLSNCWKLQLIKCGYECVKSNVDMCMPLPPAAEMIFGLMVLNSDLLDGRMISPQGGRGGVWLEAASTGQLFSQKNATRLFASLATWVAILLRKQASRLAVRRQAETLISPR